MNIINHRKEYLMTKEERKAYMKAWREAHKEEFKEYSKAYSKAYYQAHNEEKKAKNKAYYQANKDEIKEYSKAYKQTHKDEIKAYQKAYKQSDLNSLGQTKHSIRLKSLYYLKKYGTIIPGYQIHHCCTYDDPYKFIYCNRELHKLIHSYLIQHNIDADSEHYDQIKHLLDDSVFLYNI